MPSLKVTEPKLTSGLFTVVIDDGVNDKRRVNYSASFPVEPNSDDIVSHAVSKGLIQPEDTEHATGSQVDFTVEGGGSLYLLRPHSPAAKEWIAEHIPNDAQTLGDAIAVEHRYIADIVQGALGDGLVVI